MLLIPWHEERVQMTYTEFCQVWSREARVAHCNWEEIEKGEGHQYHVALHHQNRGLIASKETQLRQAKIELKDLMLRLYNIELVGSQGHLVHLCHLCEHNCHISKKDPTKHTCVNPYHLYWGTAGENNADKTPEARSLSGSAEGGRAAVRRQMELGIHNTQLKYTCEDCGRVTVGLLGHRSHVRSCRARLERGEGG